MMTIIRYEVTLADRSPAASGAPTITLIGQIAAPSGLSYTDTLNRESQATVSFLPTNQESAIKARFVNLKDNPTELTINRITEAGSVSVFTGPVLGYQVQGQTVSVIARGLGYYFRYMALESSLSYTATDQFSIVKGLIDAYQNLAYGHYGIDATSMGVSGKTRARSYDVETDHHNIFDRIVQLAEVEDGFDWHVDHTTREMDLWYLGSGGKGSDKSSSVILDRRMVASPDIVVSVAAEDVASEARVFGSGTTAQVLGTASNTSLRSTFGRCTIGGSSDGVSDIATATDHAQRLLDVRNDQLLLPAPQLIPVEGASIHDFDTGDIVNYGYDHGFGLVSTNRRVQTKGVTVSDEGVEDIGVEFL